MSSSSGAAIVYVPRSESEGESVKSENIILHSGDEKKVFPLLLFGEVCVCLEKN